MNNFLQQYGLMIVAVIITLAFIVFASVFGGTITGNIDDIANDFFNKSGATTDIEEDYNEEPTNVSLAEKKLKIVSGLVHETDVVSYPYAKKLKVVFDSTSYIGGGKNNAWIDIKDANTGDVLRRYAKYASDYSLTADTRYLAGEEYTVNSNSIYITATGAQGGTVDWVYCKATVYPIY